MNTANDINVRLTKAPNAKIVNNRVTNSSPIKQGEFKINGKTIKVKSGDSLNDIARKINRAHAGVKAEVVKNKDGSYKLLLKTRSSVLNITDTDSVLSNIHSKKLIGTGENSLIQVQRNVGKKNNVTINYNNNKSASVITKPLNITGNMIMDLGSMAANNNTPVVPIPAIVPTQPQQPQSGNYWWNMLNTAANYVSNNAPQAINTVNNALDNAQTTVGNYANNAYNAASSIWGGLSNYANSAYNITSNYVSNNAPQAINTVNNALDNAQTNAINYGNNAYNTASSIWGGLSNYANSAYNITSNYVSSNAPQAINTVNNALNTAQTTAINYATNAYNTTSNYVSNNAPQAINTVNNALNTAQTTAISYANNAYNAASSIWNRFSSAFTTPPVITGNVSTQFTSAPQTSGSTSAPQTSGSTSAPQTSGSTSAPQTSGSTSAPQTSSSTSAPQTSGSTSAPQTSSSTSAPQTSGSTSAPQNSTSTPKKSTSAQKRNSTSAPKRNSTSVAQKSASSNVEKKTNTASNDKREFWTQNKVLYRGIVHSSTPRERDEAYKYHQMFQTAMNSSVTKNRTSAANSLEAIRKMVDARFNQNSPTKLKNLNTKILGKTDNKDNAFFKAENSIPVILSYIQNSKDHKDGNGLGLLDQFERELSRNGRVGHPLDKFK